MRKAPMPEAEASVSMVKGLEKSGRAKTGADANACFSVSKACWCCGFHEKMLSFFSKSVSGLLIMP